jgi:hypothetical protein
VNSFRIDDRWDFHGDDVAINKSAALTSNAARRASVNSPTPILRRAKWLFKQHPNTSSSGLRSLRRRRPARLWLGRVCRQAVVDALGTLNFIEGLAAVGNAHFFTANANYIAGSLNTWGWVVLCIGVIKWCVGAGVFVKNQFSRWVGVVVLAGNAIVQLMMIPAYPFWSLSIFTLDILAIFGLVAYGQRISSAD